VDLAALAEVSGVFGLDSMASAVLMVLVQDLLQDQEVEEVSQVFGETLDSPGA